MFIFNHLENLIFGKTQTEDIKKENAFVNKDSNFNEILHQAVNEAARIESDNLQTYAPVNEITIERKEVVGFEPYKTEIFNEKISRDTKESYDYSSLAVKDLGLNETTAFNTSEALKLESAVVPKKSISQDLDNELKAEDSLEMIENNLEAKKEILVSKEVSSEILLQAFSKLEVEGRNSKDAKVVSPKKVIEANLEEKKSTSSVKMPTSEGQTVLSSKSAVVEVESKDSKKITAKTISIDETIVKAKEVKVEFDTKEILNKDIKREVVKDSEKVARVEDNSKTLSSQSKTKEVSSGNQKVSIEIKAENTQLTNVTPGKEELAAPGLLSVDLRKTKKSQDLESKDKSASENQKPIQREFSGIEKDFRIAKETIVEVSGLDKNKWTITRREKEVEHANLERKKEAVSLLNEIALKSSSSQTSSDSEKSFSNSRFDANTFKTFSESMKTANADKPREAGFDRENFSKSLNDLVNKARLNIVENGRNTAQISLYPKDLGKMTLNIDVTKEKVDGKILVDSEFIKNRLLSDVSQLKADLKANGLDLQSISVEVRDHSSLAFDFANPSNEKESTGEKSQEPNSSLPQFAANEEQPELAYSNKSYNLVDIKI